MKRRKTTQSPKGADLITGVLIGISIVVAVFVIMA